jgi:hypothetical protein
MSIHYAGQGTELAIVSSLANFYFADPIAYSSKDLEALAAKFHQDMQDSIDERFRHRVCLYVAAVFADICERADAGDVCITRGHFTDHLGVTSVHHWNYDKRSGLYIDAMMDGPLVFRRLPREYSITTDNLTSKQVLDIEVNTLDICCPL